VNIDQYSADQTQFIDGEDDPEAILANYNRILHLIQNYPGVEAVSVSYYGTAPGSGNWSGRTFTNPQDTTKIINGQYIWIDPGRDFFKVFAYSKDKSKQPVSVDDFDWNHPKSLVISRMIEERLFPGESALGKDIIMTMGHEVDSAYKITGVVNDIKRFDYSRPQATFYVPVRLTSESIKDAEISIRSSAQISDPVFLEGFKKEMGSSLQIGNFYLKNVSSYNYIHDRMKRMFGVSNEIETHFYMMAFFLVNILLCVMGTFWYRVSVRKEEIGLRMAIGSSCSDIRKLLFMEGICLLTVVVLPAMFIEYQFVHAGLINTYGGGSSAGNYLPDKTFLRFCITNLITWVILAVVILAAIWFPAYKASSMTPAEALHYE